MTKLSGYMKLKPVELHTAISQIRRVFSVPRRIVAVENAPGYFVTACGRVFTVRWRNYSADYRVTQLKTMRHSGGYPQVNVGYVSGRRPVCVHTLVARAFLPPPKPGQTMVRHWDDDPSNNDRQNLRWGNQKGNKRDMARNGSQTRGEKHHLAKLTEQEAIRVLVLRRAGWTYQAVADLFGVRVMTVVDICKGKNWKHLKRN